MIWHFLEVWALLFVFFVGGCLIGALLRLLLAAGPLAQAQAEALDAVEGALEEAKALLRGRRALPREAAYAVAGPAPRRYVAPGPSGYAAHDADRADAPAYDGEEEALWGREAQAEGPADDAFEEGAEAFGGSDEVYEEPDAVFDEPDGVFGESDDASEVAADDAYGSPEAASSGEPAAETYDEPIDESIEPPPDIDWDGEPVWEEDEEPLGDRALDDAPLDDAPLDKPPPPATAPPPAPASVTPPEPPPALAAPAPAPAPRPAAARPAAARPAAPAPAAKSDQPSMRPLTLPGPRNGVPDDLQRIRGIGQKNEELLNSLGIFHLGQIAAWTPAEARWVASHLAFPERIERDDWVGQAIILATGGDTGYVKAAARRKADADEPSEEGPPAASEG